MKHTPKRIKLMTDYESWPLWDIDDSDNIDPKTLPISEELKKDLDKWADNYTATLDKKEPYNTGFETEKAFQEHVNSGRKLFERLSVELPNVEILYFNDSTSKLDTISDSFEIQYVEVEEEKLERGLKALIKEPCATVKKCWQQIRHRS